MAAPRPSLTPSLLSTTTDHSTAPHHVPFFNTTFSAHRVSPLYIGPRPLDARRLQTLAQRLRDVLVGDVVRGVEVGLGLDEDGAMGRAGALEVVEMRWVGVGGVLGLGTAEEGAVEGRNMLFVGLRYEAAVCTALLVPGLGEEEDTMVGDVGGFGGGGEVDQGQFMVMPLLLLRMPAPLKAVIAEFLATEFDCRVSPLRLGTRSIVRGWESWIRTAGLPARGPLAKDVVLNLGFYLPPEDKDQEKDESEDETDDQQLGLKSIEVFIPAAELRKFVEAGRTPTKRKAGSEATWEDDIRKRRKLAGRMYEEGWEWRQQSSDEADEDPTLQQPFIEALGRYIDQHMGLNLFHPGVRITKLACGGFVMSESRLKIFAPASQGDVAVGRGSSSGQRGAVLELLRDLTQKARGQDLVG